MINHFEVGVTGGIGSGKSLICKIFSVLGIPSYNADEKARILMNEDPALKDSIKRHFGENTYDESGALDRKFLSNIVFNNKESLKVLNSLVHPQVAIDYNNWVKKQKSDIVIEEAALLYETGASKSLDFIIVVTAPEEVRIERVMKRDSRSKKQIKNIMENQWSDERKAELGDAIIVNDNSTPLISQVLAVMEKIKNEANLKFVQAGSK